jgi:hypothetical protein
MLRVIPLALMLTGCATLFGPARQRVQIISTPPGADVLVDGQLVGAAPLVLELENDRRARITLRKDGYAAKTCELGTHIGIGWIVLDILAGVWPLIVDAATGAWHSIEQPQCTGVLEPIGSSPSP